MKINEILAPRKPDKVGSSTFSKSGVQGSKERIAQRAFTTSNGNVVKVHFAPRMEDGEKSTNIVFYVNDTLSDNSSVIGKDQNTDFEILSGVLHIVLSYLDKAKLNHCSFEAFAGEGDTKTKFNIPMDKYTNRVSSATDAFYSKLVSIVITPEMTQAALDKRNILMTKLNKPLVTDVVVIYKDELLQLLSQVKKFIEKGQLSVDDISQFDQLYYSIQRHNIRVETWPEYLELMKAMDGLRTALTSHSSGGVKVTKNRRFEIYSKMLNKYFANEWDIETYHTTFNLTRKNPR